MAGGTLFRGVWEGVSGKGCVRVGGLSEAGGPPQRGVDTVQCSEARRLRSLLPGCWSWAQISLSPRLLPGPLSHPYTCLCECVFSRGAETTTPRSGHPCPWGKCRFRQDRHRPAQDGDALRVPWGLVLSECSRGTGCRWDREVTWLGSGARGLAPALRPDTPDRLRGHLPKRQTSKGVRPLKGTPCLGRTPPPPAPTTAPYWPPSG